uniref:Ion_trans domain-containing protein n=1 Tax=Macrostomum lignano TaxID=282301 RepID=A0A1I8GX71_9PLAT
MLYLLFLSCLTAFVVLNMPPKTSTPFTTAICFNDSNKSSFGWTNNFYRLNFLYATLYALTIAFILPIGSCSHSYNSAFGMFSVAMAWSLLLFIFEYFPVWGIYPAMFQRVVTSLLKVLLMHLYLFVGFSLAFCIGMGSTDMFEYFFLSLLKTFDMTAGELDYVEIFFEKTNSFSAEMRVGILLFFIVFVIIMPICLVNMLVGIAVGDIDKLTKVASLKMEHYRINIIYDLEDFRRKFCKYIFGCLSCCICAHQRSYSFKMNSTNKAKQCCVCCCYVTDFCTCFYTFKWFKPFRDQKRYRKWLNEYGGKIERDPLAKD